VYKAGVVSDFQPSFVILKWNFTDISEINKMRTMLYLITYCYLQC